MKNLGWILAVIIAIVLVVLLFDFKLNDEGELPDVDVSMHGGALPDAEIKGPDVTIGKKNATIPVPTDVEVKTEDKEIPIPTVDVDLPEDEEGNAFDVPSNPETTE